MRILKSQHKNNSGAVFNIMIYDSEATTNPEIEFKCGPDFFKLKNEGSTEDTFKRIIPSSLTFTVLYGCPDYSTEQDEAVTQFYNDLTNSYEGRFYIQVTGMGQTLFRGKILPDVGDYLVHGYGDFIVTAIDGITDLKGIEYRPTGYTDLTSEFAIQTKTFNEHFLDIIERIDTIIFFKELFNSSSIAISLLATANNWTETYSVAGDIFSQVKVRNYWFEQITPSYRKYQTCWEALTDLLTGLNCRICYERGRYYVEQLTIQDNIPSNITYYHYIKNGTEVITGTALTKAQHNYDTDDNILAGPFITQRRLPAFKAIELRQGKQFTNYINGMELSVDGNSGPFDFGYVIGEGNKMVFQWHSDIVLGSAWSAAPYFNQITAEWILEFKVKVGDFYMIADDPKYGPFVDVNPNGQYHISAGGTVPVINWTLTESTVKVRWIRTFVSSTLADFNNQVSAYRSFVRNSALVMESSEIPENGFFEMELISFTTKRNGTTIGGFPPGIYQLVKSSRIIIASGYNDLYELPKGIKRYEIGDSRNSIIYKVELGYYDSDKATINQLFMKIVGNPNFSELPTIEWTDPDSGLTLPIEELMMKSMLSMRAFPANTINIELFNRNSDTDKYIGYTDQVVFNDKVHILLDREMIASGPGGFTTYKSVLWEVYKDYIGINVVDTGEPEVEPNDFPIPDGNLDLFNSAPDSGLEYWEEWFNISTPYVSSIEGEDYALVNTDAEYNNRIKKQWQLYINGVKQLYTPTGTLALRQWRFDQDNNRIVFFKGSGNVAHIEVFKYY